MYSISDLTILKIIAMPLDKISPHRDQTSDTLCYGIQKEVEKKASS